jgi:hypothetical protein
MTHAFVTHAFVTHALGRSVGGATATVVKKTFLHSSEEMTEPAECSKTGYRI